MFLLEFPDTPCTKDFEFFLQVNRADQVGRNILFYAAHKFSLVDMRIIMENSKFTALEQKDQDGLTVLNWCDLWGFCEGNFQSISFISVVNFASKFSMTIQRDHDNTNTTSYFIRRKHHSQL